MEASRYFGKLLSGQIHVVDFPKFSPKNPKRKINNKEHKPIKSWNQTNRNKQQIKMSLFEKIYRIYEHFRNTNYEKESRKQTSFTTIKNI